MDAPEQHPDRGEQSLQRRLPRFLDIPRQQVQELVDGAAALDGQPAVHIGLAERHARVQGDFEGQCGLVKPDRHRRTFAAAETVRLSAAVRDRQFAFDNQPAEYGCEHEHGSSPWGFFKVLFLRAMTAASCARRHFKTLAYSISDVKIAEEKADNFQIIARFSMTYGDSKLGGRGFFRFLTVRRGLLIRR